MRRRFDILGLIEAWAARLKRAFVNAIALIRDRAQIGIIARMLDRGDVEGAVRAVGLDPVAFRGFEAEIAQAFEAGGNAAMGNIPAAQDPEGIRLDILFNARNPQAERWLNDHSSTLVREIVDDQRTMIREALTAGMAAGRNPRDVALDLVGRINPGTRERSGGAIGLTASQEGWVRAYAAELAEGNPKALERALRDKRFDRSIEKAIREGRPLDTEMQVKMVAAYRNRALRLRAETIARTEAMTALHQSQDQGFQQAIAAGQVQAQNVRKVWRSAGDGRVRDTHRHLNGQSVGFADRFLSTSGARLRFPGDPLAPARETVNCRCTCEYRVDFLANVA